MPKRKTPKRKKKSLPVSIIEREARTGTESNAIATARLRSQTLVAQAQAVYDYLHGNNNTAASSGPLAINSLKRDVSAVYECMHTALAARLARIELKLQAAELTQKRK